MGEAGARADRAGQTALAYNAVAGKARPHQISYKRPEIWGFFDGWRERSPIRLIKIVLLKEASH